jgi:hypothetical protein
MSTCHGSVCVWGFGGAVSKCAAWGVSGPMNVVAGEFFRERGSILKFYQARVGGCEIGVSRGLGQGPHVLLVLVSVGVNRRLGSGRIDEAHRIWQGDTAGD